MVKSVKYNGKGSSLLGFRDVSEVWLELAFAGLGAVAGLCRRFSQKKRFLSRSAIGFRDCPQFGVFFDSKWKKLCFLEQRVHLVDARDGC